MKNNNNNLNKKPLDFIENKTINYDSLSGILESSREQNHWANFGPVTTQLEAHLHNKLKLSNKREVVMCKSGTSAIMTLVSLCEIKAKKKLNWVISAFGFIASNTGPLHSAEVIDCDKNGLLDIQKLAQLPKDKWDAVLFTNTFSICQDITPLVNLCKEQNKYLIIDNAVGLDTTWREKNPVNEAISFHQTKPWGMGEAGCLIIDAEDKETVCSLICFGRGESAQFRQHYTNEKLADINSAIILQRMLDWPNWSQKYLEQLGRIINLAKSCHLKPMINPDDGTIHSHIPFLAPHEISKEQIKNPYITMQKYYRPLRQGYQNAEHIYSRIINIPCHSGLSQVSDKLILNAIEYIMKKSK